MRLRLERAPAAASMRAPLRLEREGTDCCRSAALAELVEREAAVATVDVAAATCVRLALEALVDTHGPARAAPRDHAREPPPRPPRQASTTVHLC
jgi:hypothetical protein